MIEKLTISVRRYASVPSYGKLEEAHESSLAETPKKHAQITTAAVPQEPLVTGVWQGIKTFSLLYC